ncbi:MAG: amino acid permease, partial [Gemmataceae bacterium]|nr:amino acid permease [Gemmataceae bacterium]
MQHQRDSLPRVLGPVAATAIVIGTVIGSGVFLTPRAIAQAVPYPGLAAVCWIIGGLLAMAGALVYAEVCALIPAAGGNYVFLRDAYGRLFGWMWGWVDFWMIRAGSIAALATAFAISAHDVWTSKDLREALGWPAVGPVPDWAQRLAVVLVIAGLALVNARGVKWGGGLQVFVTLVKVGTIAAVALFPLLLLAADAPGPSGERPTTERLNPLWPEEWSWALTAAMGGALLSVLWPYHGWQNIGPVAGEVKEPQRNLPLALIAGVGVILLLYLGCNLAYHLMLTPAEIASKANETPTATRAALKLLGPIGTAAMSFVILCSVFGSLNGNLLVGPRLLYAMGQDGLAP